MKNNLNENVSDSKPPKSFTFSNEDWLVFFHAIGQPVMVLDHEHTILKANQASAAALHVPPAALEGKKCWAIWHGLGDPPPDCPLQKLKKTKQLEYQEMEIEVLGRTFLVTCTPVLDRNGEVDKVIHVATDISAKKKAERQLKKHISDLELLARTAMDFMDLNQQTNIYEHIGRQVYDLTAQSAIVAVSSFDREKSVFRPHCVLGINEKIDKLFELLGRAPMEMAGDFSPAAKHELAKGRLVKLCGDLHDLSPAVLGKAVSTAITKLFSITDIYLMGFVHQGEILGGVIILPRAAAQPLQHNLLETFIGQSAVALSRYRAQKQTAHYASLATQELEKKNRLQEQLLHAQKMEAVGRMAGGVAHDFNNTLGVIIGYAELMLETLDKQDPLRADLAEIHTAAQRAAALTKQLLAFSRKQILKPQHVDLNAVITQLQNMLGRLLGEDVELVTNLHTAQCPIHIDPGQLEQVLANLAVNARDAMPNGGCLQIKTRLRDLDAPLEIHGEKADFAPGPHVLLDVIDNGTGMDAQTQKRVFEPFYTTKREGKGTGLGLSTVYGIVQQSGGSIRVQSQPGLGTTFSIAFPLSDQPAPTPPVTKTASPTGSETLLVVEDEEILRRLMVRILSTGGYEVLTACCGREALQIIETTEVPISLVLSDVVMPEMSGYELARKLHTLHPEIKILFTSGYTTASRPEDKTQVEHTAFIQKPFSTTALLKTIRILLDAD